MNAVAASNGLIPVAGNLSRPASRHDSKTEREQRERCNVARSRNIKPGFFVNDEIVELPFEIRLLFIGLWTLVDRDGRMLDRPKKIKMSVFPADNVDVDKGLNLLQQHGFIIRYRAGESLCIQVVNWEKHQHPHHKEESQNIPPPDNPGLALVLPRSNPADSLNPITDSLNPHNGYSDQPSAVPVPVKSKSKKFIKPDKQELLAYVTERDTSGRPKDVAKAIWNHYESNGWKVGKNPMKSWQAAASGWIGRDM